jgi:hypothetical protein
MSFLPAFPGSYLVMVMILIYGTKTSILFKFVTVESIYYDLECHFYILVKAWNKILRYNDINDILRTASLKEDGVRERGSEHCSLT